MIPKFLSHLPVQGGLPVPFVNMWIDGVADLRVLDIEKVMECLHKRLCGICGKKVGAVSWFIGGTKTMRYKIFTDPQMHEGCAKYAAKTCPFVSGKKGFSNRPVKCPVKIIGEMDEGRTRMYLVSSRTQDCCPAIVQGTHTTIAGSFITKEEILREDE